VDNWLGEYEGGQLIQRNWRRTHRGRDVEPGQDGADVFGQLAERVFEPLALPVGGLVVELAGQWDNAPPRRRM
jgi:hypothetical protein